MNKIVKYQVRRPDACLWSEHRSERSAHREARNADKVIDGHRVYAVHENGDVTGPYYEHDDALNGRR